MRHFLSTRLWLIFGILGVSALVVLSVFTLLPSSTRSFSSTPTSHNIELIAAVSSVVLQDNWKMLDGVAAGNATLSLDDGRTIEIVDGTTGQVTCTNLIDPFACVILADMLGNGVVWFALVPADASDGKKMLTLPPLVDMLRGGSAGVLQNGWIIKLGNGVKRTCDTDSVSLREFITKNSSAGVTMLDLLKDEVTEVVCSS
ncbi:MAG: hypothetical protein D4R44_06820 [Actinobacteria bacterium]|nr:MAG: hypothetical protein D4R44_06820 [Actinomycetota bacterium]